MHDSPRYGRFRALTGDATGATDSQLSTFDDVESGLGQKAVGEVPGRINTFAEHYQPLYPVAVKCLLSDVESLTAYLRFPREHAKRIRHSNFIERTFG